jgi:hypothetical protein
VLTGTLSDGIVSAVGRKVEDASFLQVTVPVNPGNSGGPLFDDDGRVVGVNTFTIRRNARGNVRLEALNFALESDFVHEIVADPSRKSLDAAAMAAILNPSEPERPRTLREAMAAKVKRFERAGYRQVESLRKVFRLRAGQRHVIGLQCHRAGRRAVAVVSAGAEDIDLASATVGED